MHSKIALLPSAQIDHEKWDQCIAENANGLLYSTSAYLNAMAENWAGLVVGNYKHIMPLPWKKKLGIRYGYTPTFIQQLGITGIPDAALMQIILDNLKKFYPFGDIHFNFANGKAMEGLNCLPKTNLQIDLRTGYENIYDNYRNDLKENIKKAGSLEYVNGKHEQAIGLFASTYQSRLGKLHKNDYLHFKKLCQTLKQKNQCFTRMARNKDGKLLAIALFLSDNKRVYNIMNTTLPEGRNLKANHFLLDKVLQELSGQSLLFDFEGSEIPGVKHFYEGFGGQNQPYFHFRHNGFPWPFSLLGN